MIIYNTSVRSEQRARVFVSSRPPTAASHTHQLCNKQATSQNQHVFWGGNRLFSHLRLHVRNHQLVVSCWRLMYRGLRLSAASWGGSWSVSITVLFLLFWCWAVVFCLLPVWSLWSAFPCVLFPVSLFSRHCACLPRPQESHLCCFSTRFGLGSSSDLWVYLADESLTCLSLFIKWCMMMMCHHWNTSSHQPAADFDEAWTWTIPLLCSSFDVVLSYNQRCQMSVMWRDELICDSGLYNWSWSDLTWFFYLPLHL